MEYKFGYFNEEGNEFVVTRPDTPRAFDNFLWNNTLFSNAGQTGVGCLDYQIGDSEAVQLFTGIGRICDFDVFGREHLMNRLIYVRDNETEEIWNINWEPVKRAYTSYQCTHGLGYSVIENETLGIKALLLMFVPCGDDPVELWSVKLINTSSRKRSLTLFTYSQIRFMFKWGFDSYGDMIYRTSWFDSDRNVAFASKHPFRKPHDFLTCFMTSDTPIAGFDGSRNRFVGTYNTLGGPAAVINGKCSNTPGSAEDTIIALQFDVCLDASEQKSIEIITGITNDAEQYQALSQKYLGKFDFYLNELKQHTKEVMSQYTISTPDKHLDRLVNTWIKQGALYGGAWCRWGYMGYRDIVQHGFGIVGLKPERTREILLKALAHQYSSGLAVRGWNPIDEKPYSDSALWLIFSLTAYIKETGDIKILDETVPYFDCGEASVLAHVETSVSFFEKNKGAHDLLLIKFGDWNDSLTGVGKEGRGESVWLSLAYAEAMYQMAELYEFYGDHIKKQECLENRSNILEAINTHAWDGKWYVRCFDDSGKEIGSAQNRFAKIFMEPQCWALISGASHGDRTEQLIQSCDELLGTKAGYLLLSPAYTEVDNNIGRISSMEPGIAENGTIYSHLNIWMVLGLLKCGMADKAYELFQKFSPGYINDEFKNNALPYMYANCYFGPEHKNSSFQMEFSWITGSLAWLNHVPVQYMLGVRADYKGLIIDPCLPTNWNEAAVTKKFRGATYKINICKTDGKTGILVDGKEFEGNTLPIFEANSEHEVVVKIKK